MTDKLETVGIQHLRSVDGQWHYGEAEYANQDERELVTRSQAEAIIALERAENDEAYELGKRDGYSEVVQEIDLKTGGDGEYRYCTDHDPERHTPDPVSMIQRIVERFETLNTMESISEIHEWKERADKAETNNAALTARVEELEKEGWKELHDAAQKTVKERTEACNSLYKQVNALETQLAAAKYLISRAQEIIPGNYMHWHGFARSALEDRP